MKRPRPASPKAKRDHVRLHLVKVAAGDADRAAILAIIAVSNGYPNAGELVRYARSLRTLLERQRAGGREGAAATNQKKNRKARDKKIREAFAKLPDDLSKGERLEVLGRVFKRSPRTIARAISKPKK